MTKVAAAANTGTASAKSDFGAAVIAGLRQAQKCIPSRFFYDARGSTLFEEITHQPEYYQTRTELQLLLQHRDEIAPLLGGRALIEPGSGSSRKTEVLIEAGAPAAYIAVDVSRSALDEAMGRLEQRWPLLATAAIVADFRASWRMPASLAELPRFGFFPGSTIGNLTRTAAVELLSTFRRVLSGGHLLIGVDMPNEPDIMHAAYNDSEGVTARFNLNLLARANRELGADFDVGAWQHEATYDVRQQRIDMWLVSRQPQSVHLLGHTFRFAAGERIHTELSQKYAPDEFASLAAKGGFRSEQRWLSASPRRFSLHLLAA